jgi:hypothetical protein
MKYLVFISLILSSLSYGREFKIPQGSHRSYPIVTKAFVGTKMGITAIFDESAKYEFSKDSSSDQGDINKLYGFSDCNGPHLQNSARFGWNWYQNKLSIYAFTHVSGQMNFRYLSDVEFNKPYSGTIQIHPDKRSYIFNFNGISVQMDRGCQDQKAWGYELLPYFGGQQVAPHDITINVKLNESQTPVIVDLPYPNPTRNGRFRLNINSTERIPFYIKIYDSIGRLVYKSNITQLMKDVPEVIQYDIGHKLSSGIYIVTPMAILHDGRELPTHVTNQGHDKSFKLIILNQ